MIYEVVAAGTVPLALTCLWEKVTWWCLISEAMKHSVVLVLGSHISL